MAVTRLKRKGRRKAARAHRRHTAMKKQNFKPVMKLVDVEKIKEGFKSKGPAKKEKEKE